MEAKRTPREILRDAGSFLVGGVNSPVRALTKPRPLIVTKGEGPYIYDIEYGELLDNVLGYGPLILGHRHPEVQEEVEKALENGWLYGALAPVEVDLARLILRYVKPGGKIRFVNSGTEATMLAVRLARAYTGRDKIVKFDGAYHGAHDHVLVAAGSAATHLGVPQSPGIPKCVAENVIVAEYNDFEDIEKVFQGHGSEIAGVIVEPVIGNFGVIPPHKGFLQHLRRLTRKHGALLILDEVITGFRLGMRGAQGYYGVEADIVTLGKIIGGGFPVGAVAGNSDIMDMITPKGKVFNAGTFNGHPVTMAAGLATLRVLEREGLSKAVEAAKAFEDIIRDVLDKLGMEYALNRVESMLQVFLGVTNVDSPRKARMANRKLYERLHEEMLRQGVLIPPSQYESIFTSIVHGVREVERFQEAFRVAAGRITGWSSA